MTVAELLDQQHQIDAYVQDLLSRQHSVDASIDFITSEMLLRVLRFNIPDKVVTM